MDPASEIPNGQHVCAALAPVAGEPNVVIHARRRLLGVPVGAPAINPGRTIPYWSIQVGDACVLASIRYCPFCGTRLPQPQAQLSVVP